LAQVLRFGPQIGSRPVPEELAGECQSEEQHDAAGNMAQAAFSHSTSPCRIGCAQYPEFEPP
jgi:hypothetical protein